MRKAGGIIGIVSGVLAVLAAGITLMLGGVGSTVDAGGAGTVILLGWGGVVFSFLIIVLGAVMIGSKTSRVGVLMMLCALFGALFGGTLVAVFMVLAFVGGLLALFEKKEVPADGDGEPAGGYLQWRRKVEEDVKAGKITPRVILAAVITIVGTIVVTRLLLDYLDTLARGL